MPARLILNADDFGLTPGINRAVAELNEAGVLTSATLMANGPAFDDAATIARRLPALGVGCHVVLTDGVPLSDPAAIPSLLGRDRKSFRPTLGEFVRALLAGRIRDAEIALEIRAQIQRLRDSGISVTHVDTHKHTHIFPAVLRPLLRVAAELGVTAVRNPFEPAWSASLDQGSLLRRAAVRATALLHRRFYAHLRNTPVTSTGGTLGISATGDLTASSLSDILHHLPASGAFELCCHPGYNDAALDAINTRLRGTREIERDALLSVLPQILSQPNAPHLIHYGELSVSAPKLRTA